jgi:hypothetical protein
MTKAELLAKVASVRAKQNLSEAEIKNAEDTIANIETPVTDAPIKPAENVPAEPKDLPTQKDVEKAVADAEGPIVPADKDGISKNGGEDEGRMDGDGIEVSKAKEDNKMKDAINVADRKVQESEQVKDELLRKVEESAAREEELVAKINEITTLCEAALLVQADNLTKEHATEMAKIFESVIAKGEAIENKLNASIVENKKLYESAKAHYASASKLNKILLEAVKKAQPERKLTRYTTFARRASEIK